MRYCKGCQADLDDNQFNGDYNYCKACYNNYKSRPKNKRKSVRTTCVYFIKSGDLIKIGYTEEQVLHKKFAHLNKTGEWFYAAQELLDFIQTV